MASYSSVYNTNQGTFNNPRQKTWVVMQLSQQGWGVLLTTSCFDEAKETVNNSLRHGVNLDELMMSELVPIDSVITPSV